MNRRDFIKSAIIGAAGVSLPFVAGSGSPDSAAKRIQDTIYYVTSTPSDGSAWVAQYFTEAKVWKTARVYKVILDTANNDSGAEIRVGYMQST